MSDRSGPCFRKRAHSRRRVLCVGTVREVCQLCPADWTSRETYCILRASQMKGSFDIPIAPGRKTAAWVCLVAAILLWAPLWVAAFQTNGMGCCAAGLCPAHGRHNPEKATERQTASNEASGECEQHQGSGHKHQGAMSCSMSCYHQSGDSLMTAAIFIMPATPTLCRPAGATTADDELTSRAFIPAIKPPSPPPRPFLSPL